eukprot:m.106523 g.106523  ORF g.106523 m.106523 type:complete len:899 (+) comp10591_c1_seq1:83-2779(+)
MADGATDGHGGGGDAAGAGPSLPQALGDHVGPPITCRGGATWHVPTGGTDVGLVVNNTLTAGAGGKKGADAYVPFVPASGRKVKWYTCGPTVYDSAHLGHARAYLTFDILRRIVEDYFGYEVMYHVNVTDVDDKIIKRARRGKLIADFVTQHSEGPQGFDTARAAVDAAVAARVSKLQAKVNKLESAPEPGTSQEQLEAETELKETRLKLDQVMLTRERVERVVAAVTAGSEGVLSDLEAQAKANGLPPTPPVMSDWPLSQRLASFTTHLAGTGADSSVIATTHRLKQLADSVEGVVNDGSVAALAAAATDEIGEALDNELGSTVRDHAIFNEHARAFEREYMEDMELLGVRPPDVLTRVTEYIDGIIDFVQKIVDNGLAYASNGSVYLSIADFKASGHSYRKLKPGGDTTEKEMAEGEGDLAGDVSEKRHPNDFALWKASKPGEPEWDSPWGKGRPGWHIECSAIASDILGPYMDVHAGGIDLCFPHHDNELAQSEACFGHHQWVSYFFHAGHLHIKGLKMSKSLKNFITIRQALAKHTSPVDGSTTQTTARHIRLMFLMQAWDKPMDYSDSEIANARKRERKFRNFFAAATEHVGTDWLGSGQAIGWSDSDRELQAQLDATKDTVHAALCNNFNTKDAMMAIDSLVTSVNKALDAATAPDARPPAHLLVRSAAVYVTKMLRVFGVVDSEDAIGFGASEGMGADGGVDVAATVGPFVESLVGFRDTVRSKARSKAEPKEFLEACDTVRDETLVDLGVRLEDSTQEGVPSRWRLDNPEVLRQELAEKRAAELERERQKAQRKLAKREGDLAKAKAAALNPSDFFADVKKEYSEFDEAGVPTKLADGTELAKKAYKGLVKKFNAHVKDHDKLMAAAKGDVAGYLAAIEAEIAALKAQVA